ncbi:hypothetical protein [Arenimonas oryziterrae]|uniref:Uncharacterized protein n=1 Tax=Arenimonas oryziterrae DSM 21050 = YC6267 TaxID=1121015 RepID=A0A091AQA4_9GAMM|nr:hypothetical protein [Arenimonas oryziterrae]KFN42348.1 hypothetical protein N789_14255 [Arenimonas oryziterrae DSM 21050 = YC6267]
MKDLIKNLALAARPGSLIFFDETVASNTPDSVTDNVFVWSAAPTVVAGGYADLGYIDTAAGMYAAAGGREGCPAGASRGISSEYFLRVGSVPSGTAIVSYLGAASHAWYLKFNGSTQTIGLHDGTTEISAAYTYLNQDLHIVCTRSRAGAAAIYVNGVLLVSGTLAAAANETTWRINGDNTSTPVDKISARMYLQAHYARELTPSQILARYRSFLVTHKLAGTAVLEVGGAASQVLIRRASDRLHLATVTPAVDGTWEALVPPDDYEVCLVGPSGYTPKSFSPVAAVLA